MPALELAGLDKDALFKLIDRYGEIDEKCWNTGRVSLPLQGTLGSI